MLKKLRHQRLINNLKALINSADLALWPEIRGKVNLTDLTTPIEGNSCALQLCIEAGNAKLLGEFLHHFPQLMNRRLGDGRLLLEWVFAADQRLAFLSAMLANGLDPNQQIENSTLVEISLNQTPQAAMLLVNRLAQHGATLENPRLLQMALKLGDTSLLKFLVDSGAPLEISDTTEKIDPELLAFTRRAIEDKRIRDLWA